MVGNLSRPASYKTMLGRLCLGAMLVRLAIDEVNLLLCYELCAVAFKTSSVKTFVLVWLLSVVTCGHSLTMSQAEVPLEWIHVIYGKWVRSIISLKEIDRL